MSNSDTITLSGLYTTGTGYSSLSIGGAGGVGSAGGAGGTYTIGSLSTANTISGINIDDFNITIPEEWINCFPDFKRIEKMCKEYPGLKIAYEKFVTTYKLVADHYDTPEDKRPKP
jgi:hypothetical protein